MPQDRVGPQEPERALSSTLTVVLALCVSELRTRTETTAMNGSELNSIIKVCYLNGRYSNRGIGAARVLLVRATHADSDRDDRHESRQ